MTRKGFGKKINTSGFTLLELLIAIFIFSIIVTIVLTAFSRTMSNVEVVQSTASAYEAAKNAMDRIVTDLESVRITMPPAYTKPESRDDPDPWRISSEVQDAGLILAPTFRFASSAHVDFSGAGQTGIAEIVYYITPDPGNESELVLRRKDTLFWDLFDQLEETHAGPILCDRIKSVEFIFFDQESDEYETWNSDSEEFKYATPGAVKVRLEIKVRPEDEQEPFCFETIVNMPMFRQE